LILCQFEFFATAAQVDVLPIKKMRDFLFEKEVADFV
jgi:hypothetical protein